MLHRLLQRIPWSDGRQGTGYKKFRFFESWNLMADCYLLYYPEGSVIPPHTDEWTGKRHFRLNIVLHQPKRGGEFKCANCIINRFPVYFFRPDANEHSVTKIEEGYRLVFSLGWVR